MTRGRLGRGIVTSPLGFKICTARIASIANGGSSESLSTVTSPWGAPYLEWGSTTDDDTVADACVEWGRGEGSLGEAWGDGEAAAVGWNPVAP